MLFIFLGVFLVNFRGLWVEPAGGVAVGIVLVYMWLLFGEYVVLGLNHRTSIGSV